MSPACEALVAQALAQELRFERGQGKEIAVTRESHRRLSAAGDTIALTGKRAATA